MKLTEAKIRSAKPGPKAAKLFDGGGLYLYVTPEGGKHWRWACVSYDLKTSAGRAFVGAYSAGNITLTQSPLPASYIVDAIATVPASGGTLDCSPSELNSAALTPVPGTTVLVPTLAFAGCQ